MHTLIRPPLGLTASVALLAQLCASHALAESTENVSVREVQVSTHGFNLTLPSDRAVLTRKLEYAAREVCGLFDGNVSSTSYDYLECHKEALREALQQMQAMVDRSAARIQVARISPAQIP